MRDRRAQFATARQKLYDILESPFQDTHASAAVNRSIGTLLILSIGATVLGSVPRYAEAYGELFRIIEIVSLAVFSIEYGLRIWIAPEHLPYRHLRPIAARRAYIVSGQGIIDVLAVAPLWAAAAGFEGVGILVILRILRVLKFVRYSSGMRSLLEALASERRALGACLVILLSATLISATAMYIVEGQLQPDDFGTIPDAMWWAIVTLSTLGYGDVVPQTVPGRLIASVTIVGGLIMIALPVGIVASAFSQIIHRRDFIVNWSMVARVPLFSHLTAADIAHIMQLLVARQADRGEIIVRRGEPAHAMYFIAEGEVDIELGPEEKGRRVRLGAGHFFGESAVLKGVERSATVTSVTRVRLLVLDAANLRALILREPGIAEKITRIADGRAGRQLDLALPDDVIAGDAG